MVFNFEFLQPNPVIEKLDIVFEKLGCAAKINILYDIQHSLTNLI